MAFISSNPSMNLAQRENALSQALSELANTELQLNAHYQGEGEDATALTELLNRLEILKALIGDLRTSISYHKEDLNQQKAAQTKLGEISKA